MRILQSCIWNLEKSDGTVTAPALVGVDATSKQQEAIRKGDRDWLCFPAALCYGISDDLGGS